MLNASDTFVIRCPEYYSNFHSKMPCILQGSEGQGNQSVETKSTYMSKTLPGLPNTS